MAGGLFFSIYKIYKIDKSSYTDLNVGVLKEISILDRNLNLTVVNSSKILEGNFCLMFLFEISSKLHTLTPVRILNASLTYEDVVLEDLKVNGFYSPGNYTATFQFLI
ncbi:hypothetical protein HanPI659440_Chr12g0472831 [Helianthus annuus]|nr:hypothetical protein HanPI659440_Chr12g0472831 [Helianthus annuus]